MLTRTPLIACSSVSDRQRSVPLPLMPAESNVFRLGGERVPNANGRQDFGASSFPSPVQGVADEAPDTGASAFFNGNSS